jgi:hypothetical protein
MRRHGAKDKNIEHWSLKRQLRDCTNVGRIIMAMPTLTYLSNRQQGAAEGGVEGYFIGG